MTTHTNKKLGITFDTPDSLTVREQLAFMSIIHSGDDENQTMELRWQASLPLIHNWQCDLFQAPN